MELWSQFLLKVCDLGVEVRGELPLWHEACDGESLADFFLYLVGR